jgi:hypothetical protein
MDPKVEAHIALGSDAISTAYTEGSASAYRHPLGFYHLTLPSTDPARKLRLHMWFSTLADETIEMPQIHNHAFRFKSLVVCGAIRHTPFKLSRPSSTELHKVLRIEQEGENTYLVDTGELVRVRPQPPHTYSAGQMYSFPENAYHLSESVGEAPTMTLVVAEKVADVTSFVLAPAKAGYKMVWRKEWLSAKEVRAFLEKARSRLTALRGACAGAPGVSRNGSLR